MIIRVFRARVQPGMANAFERMVRELSILLVEDQKGLLATQASLLEAMLMSS